MSCWANGKIYDTLQEAIESLGARGGVVDVGAGHVEVVSVCNVVALRNEWWALLWRRVLSLLGLEVGITIIGHGQGDHRPHFIGPGYEEKTDDG